MRKVFSFHGGIHPPGNKQQSTTGRIADPGIPPQLVVPLSQHIGAPAAALVSTGERVLKGQLIAAANGFVSVAQHAPSSGVISAIEERPIPHPSGYTAPCVVIDCDGDDEWVVLEGVADYRQLEPGELLERVRQAGIAGLGGAGFPAAVKLAGRAGSKIDTLIINGTECEPYITADDMLMRERAADIIAGTEILRHIIAPHTTVIGVEDNKPEALAALRTAAAGSDLEIAEFPTKYPSGGEKQLIEILTGKQVPSGGLPADIGIVCQNVGTAAAIYQAIHAGRPLISRITTVTGEAVARPGNFDVLIGTPISYLLQRAGYDPRRNNRLVMGGPMMGFTLPDPGVPIVKTTNCILAPSEAELPTPAPAQACIRCGMCSEACPASLLPQQLYWFAQGKEYEKLEHHNLFDCIECGACSWVCPSNIPLVQYYRASKADILQQRRDHAVAEHSRMRFESRQQRLEQETQEQEVRRAARKQAAEARARQAATDPGSTADPIQAAIDRARAKKAAQPPAGTTDAQDPAEQLTQTVAKIRARVQTAEAKLAEAQAGSETSGLVAALTAAVDKTRAKLVAAEQALIEHPPAEAAMNASDNGDPAASAIARAQATRAARAEQNPQEQAEEQLARLRQRLEKTRARLQQGRDDGESDKILDALIATVERLETKLAEAETVLSAAREN